MADLPPLTPPDVDRASWLDDDDHTTIRKSLLARTERKNVVVLYDPDHARLNFGPASRMEAQSGNIQFGEVEPHFAVVDREHPALDTRDEQSLFRRERRIVIIRNTGKPFGDDEQTEREPPRPTRRASAKP